MKLNHVTLCCIDNQFPDQGFSALLKSTKSIAFEKTIFFTSSSFVEPKHDIANFEIKCVDHLTSIDTYSHFLIKELGQYIDTSHVLIVQWDGFIVDSSKWLDSFLAYDYVGAPWDGGDEMLVGNGGFSLRSKRLMNALREVSLEVYHPEDDVICRQLRPLLEEKFDIQFCPVDLAKEFSFETIKPVNETFGFHGLFNLPIVLNESDLKDFVDSINPSILFHGHWSFFYQNCLSLGNQKIQSAIEFKILDVVKRADLFLVSKPIYRSLIKSCMFNKKFHLAKIVLSKQIGLLGWSFDRFILLTRIYLNLLTKSKN
jgi:hypothetical protein